MNVNKSSYNIEDVKNCFNLAPKDLKSVLKVEMSRISLLISRAL